MNRLKDSFLLWKSIVGSKLLQNATVIRTSLPLILTTLPREVHGNVVAHATAVFMNKCDLLEKKLKAGVKVNKYIPRYGERENSMPIFARCAYLPFSHTVMVAGQG